MSSRWLSGTPALRAAVDRWIEDPRADAGETLSQSAYRRVVRLDLKSVADPIVVKQFFPVRMRPTATKRALARVQLLARRSPAEREWNALQRLQRLGVPVPEPLAFARRAGGGALIVTRHIAHAKTLDRALDGYAFEQRRRLRQVGELIHRLHSAGSLHGDLHVGNILVTEAGPVLIDLQRVRPVESAIDRIRDIAFLDFSLYHAGVSRSNRLRLRIAAMNAGHFRVASERETLREIGRASQARAIDYYHGRTRRTLRPSREFVPVGCGDRVGMRLAEFSEAALHAAVAAHRHQVEVRGSSLIKCDHRSQVSAVDALGRRVVVKEVVNSSARRRLADVFRGSPGRRAWVGGHGLQIRGVGVARPLAYLEQRRWGVPCCSLVVLDDLSWARCVADLKPTDPETQPLPGQLLGLAIRLHRSGVLHADLQSIHIYLTERDGKTELALIDLEGVRFRKRLHDRQRIQMLSELNATLDDDLIGAGTRAELFKDYLRALPFERGNERAVRQIVRLSLARNQRWRGRGVDLRGRCG